MLQLMGALYMGNKVVFKTDSKVKKLCGFVTSMQGFPTEQLGLMIMLTASFRSTQGTCR